jgi:hypothetical protein
MKECLLWQQARDLGQQRGLELDPVCPLDKKCTGTTCVFIDAPKEAKEDIDKFYEKMASKNTDLAQGEKET